MILRARVIVDAPRFFGSIVAFSGSFIGVVNVIVQRPMDNHASLFA